MSEKKYPVTNFLITVNVLIFTAGLLLNVHISLIEFYSFSLEKILQQRWDVFFTSGFLHSDPLHIMYNMLFLWIFGRACEEEFGTAKTVTIYFSSMILGSFLFGILFPEQAAIGASGAVSGLVAAAVLVEPGKDIHPTISSFPIAFLALAFLLPTTMNAFSLAGNTANIAHVGGALGGALFALLLKPKQAWKNVRNLWIIWAAIAVMLVLVLITVLLRA